MPDSFGPAIDSPESFNTIRSYTGDPVGCFLSFASCALVMKDWPAPWPAEHSSRDFRVNGSHTQPLTPFAFLNFAACMLSVRRLRRPRKTYAVRSGKKN